MQNLKSESQKKLVDHISRLEGQLARVKTELLGENPDCGKASDTLLSASRSFAGLRLSFIESFLTTYGSKIHDAANEGDYKKLLAIIKG